MFKVIFIVIVLLGLFSIVFSQSMEKKNAQLNNIHYDIIYIDGCQYIRVRNSTYFWYEVQGICHKGNCNSTAHK